MSTFSKEEPTMNENKPHSAGDESVLQVTQEISSKARTLEQEASRNRFNHQLFTILTILLGISAPALVTYSPPPTVDVVWWKIIVILVTAFATAAATIRTVLRFSERYSNSALTSINLLDLEAKVHAKRQEVLTTVKDEFIEQKLYEISAWARAQMFEITKAYVEKEVSALTQESITLTEPPKIMPEEKSDPTKKTQD